jgi:DMATS type aromatic prenyltransferase
MNEYASRRLLEDLSKMKTDVDFQLFDYFNDVLALSNHGARLRWDSIQEHRLKSQKIVALDLHEHSVTVKSYVFPLFRSITSGAGSMRMIMDSIEALWVDDPLTLGLSKVDEYLASTKHLLSDSSTYVSFDCKESAKSRFKIYAGSNVASLREAYDFWTLGGRLKGETIDSGFRLLERIWEIVYPRLLPNGKPREYITFSWNWELTPGNPDPIPKAYFRLSEDYDSLITEAITCVFEELGWIEHLATHHKIREKA